MAKKPKPPTTPRVGWVKLTKAEAKTHSTDNKELVKHKLDQIVERVMKPALIGGRGKGSNFGAVIDVYTKWHGDSLVLIVKRRGGRVADRMVDDFEERTSRITIIGANTYAVGYFRYTGQWWTIAGGCDLNTALEWFREPGPVWPY